MLKFPDDEGDANRIGSLRNADADSASYPRPAVSAVTHRVLGQLLLMIVLGVIEITGIDDFRRNGTVPGFRQHFLISGATGLSGSSLFVTVHVNRRPILGADISTLPHALGGVVGFPENLEHCVE